MNIETSVELNTCVVYSQTFKNGTKYFGNGISAKRAYAKRGRGKRHLEQFENDPNPKVEILASGLTPAEADALEQKLFDMYITNGGIRLQKRPSGLDLQTSIARSTSDAHRDVMNSKEYREKMRIIQTGRKYSAEVRKNMRMAGLARQNNQQNRRVISMLDGRVTTYNITPRWNKKNPDYTGTWVDL
jgi:hypothetical protein